MIVEKCVLLGKSSYAIAVIADILALCNSDQQLALISNIPDENNDSLKYPYDIQNIAIIEYALDEVKTLANKDLILASIGKSRKAIYQFFEKRYDLSTCNFCPVVHPSSIIGNNSTIGKGLHLSPLSVVAPHAVLGDFVVINRNASIGHHTVLHDFVTINPGVNLSGICEIGQDTIIGAGSTVLEKIKIGQNTIIGAGSVVTKDIPEGVIAYGSPAKIIRDNKNLQ